MGRRDQVVPDVVSGQVDVLPSERGEVLEEGGVRRIVASHGIGDGVLQAGGVPQHDGGRDEVEGAGAMGLGLQGSVAQASGSVEE